MKDFKNRYMVLMPVGIALLSFLGGGAIGVHLIAQENYSDTLAIIYFSLGAFLLSSTLLVFFWVFLGRVRHNMEDDLDKRQKIEAELRQTEIEYRQIFDGVNDAVFVETLKGEVLDVNARACEIFGWSRDEFLTKTIRDMVPPENRALLPEEQDESTLSEEAFETVNMRANGEYFPVSITGRIHTIGDEKRLLVVVRDITEQKKIEYELKKQHQFLSHVIESLTQPFYVINVEDYSIAIANSAARGNNALDTKTTCYALTHRSDAPCLGGEHYCPMQEVIKTRKAVQVEHVHLTESGEPRYIEVHGYPIYDATGEIVQMIESTVDITERKQTLLDLEKAKEAAEAAAQAKSDFLANMSHEIRTPLNAIYGMTSLMLDTPLNDEQQDFIETIRGGSDTLLKVINDILDFSKIEAGKMELETQPFYVRNCVEDALDLLAEKAAGKMLDLAYFIEDNTPPVVIGDVTRLRQILVNLLNNAIKFTDKGEVVINVSSLLVENDQQELHFSVRDTGIGIPQSKIDKLFKSFSQVDTSTTRKYGGTGLGLAISNQLAQNMGGAMWVESEEGKGSTFHFTILVDADLSAKPLFSKDDVPQLSDKRILIVDDNETNRLILVKQTESWGMRPSAVASGSEALTLLAEGEKFDIAILDMQMPEMDGFTLAQKISVQQKLNALPLIILTSIKREKARSSDANVSAFLNKPIKTSSLFNVLMGIIDSVPTPRREIKKPVTIDAEMAKRHPLRILLAEDNMVNQKVALKLLSRLGYRADLAGNGIEVIEALERQTYDLIFMDIQMPEMDGDEATKQVRARWAQDRQPFIVAMTAHALEGDREKYLARGMDDYISKPISVDALVTALEKAKHID